MYQTMYFLNLYQIRITKFKKFQFLIINNTSKKKIISIIYIRMRRSVLCFVVNKIMTLNNRLKYIIDSI